MDATSDFMIQLARHTGELLLRFFRRKELITSLKMDQSLVTEADLAADDLISNAIKKQYPDNLLLSEETQTVYPENGKQQPVWIIDPLDGTTNFSLGLHFWGVLIARTIDGWPETAVLYYPAINELYVARRGKGASLNSETVLVKPPNNDQPAAFFACCSRTHQRYQVSVPYKARILGSASYSICAVARSIAVLSFEARPKIWDLAGPWLLVEEAGGFIATIDDSAPFPLQPGVDYARQSFPTCAAATPQLIQQARRQIVPKTGRSG